MPTSAKSPGKTRTVRAKSASPSSTKKRTLKSAKKAAVKRKKSTKQTLASLKKSVQTLANRYARERDCFGHGGAGCISCGQWFSFEDLDGGHYIPSTVSSTRFDERNINAQCHRCNRFLHANLRGYFRGLEAKLGRAELDRLEASAGPYKWTREELNELKAYYKQKLADLQSGAPIELANQSVSEMFAPVRDGDTVPRLSDIYQAIED